MHIEIIELFVVAEESELNNIVVSPLIVRPQLICIIKVSKKTSYRKCEFN